MTARSLRTSELCIEFPPPLCYTCGRDGGSQHPKNAVTACHRLRPPKKNTEQRGWKNGTGKAFAIARHLSCQARSAHRLLQRLNDAGIPAAVRREDGCRRYDYFLDTQDPDAILLVEDWDTTAQQQAHVQTPHMALFQTFKPDYVLSTDAQRILL